jgi:TolB-like protein
MALHGGPRQRMTALQLADSGPSPTMLVLPFASVAGDERAYLAEGVSDELAMALSQLPGLRVVARGSATNLRQAAQRPLEAAAMVGAAVVVSGTVALEGDTLHMRADLLAPETAGAPPSFEIEVPFLDLTLGVARLARRLLSDCGVAPPDDWEPRIARRISEAPEALDLVLRGRYHAEQRPIGVKLAMQCFDRAIRVDGGVAAAYGALAILWANFGIFLALSPQQAGERAREQAQRALAVAPDEPWALTALLTVATFYDWDLPRADAVGRDLLARYPSLVPPRQVLLYAHAARGDTAAVRALGREVQQLDPRAVDPVNDYAFALLLCGEAREAAALLQAHAALHPAASEVQRRLGLALLESGDAPGAVLHLERSVALSRRHTWGVANLACASARVGDGDGARALLAELMDRADGELVPAVALAEIHASLGAHDEAFRALARALEARDYWLLVLDVDPLLAPLRGDARFTAIRARRHARGAE